MQFHFHATQSHFHKNGLALRLTLKQRHKGTRKWPIIIRLPKMFNNGMLNFRGGYQRSPKILFAELGGFPKVRQCSISRVSSRMTEDARQRSHFSRRLPGREDNGGTMTPYGIILSHESLIFFRYRHKFLGECFY